MRGLAFSHTAKKRITSRPASYIRSHKNSDMQSSVKSPLISKKLTVKGGEKE